MTSFFATAPRGMESLLADELAALGASRTEQAGGGARFEGSIEVAYRACLWSRVANRVLAPIAVFDAADADALYAGTRAIDWSLHLRPGATFAVNALTVRSAIDHTHYASLKLKDAVVDQLREATGDRPNVDVEQPDLRINLYIERDQAQVAIDLSGESLHKRGYRRQGTRAPLKENLAAGALLMAGWPEAARLGRPFLDPMCGSGTFVIEAAMMAADIAPGLGRRHFGFLGWVAHQPKVWRRVLNDAERRALTGSAELPWIGGYDADPRAVQASMGNLERAGVAKLAHIERREITGWEPPVAQAGLLVTNPPWGRRLGDLESLVPLYRTIGDVLKQRFAGWDAYVLSGRRELDRAVGLRAASRQPVFAGPVECRLLSFPIRDAVSAKADGAQADVDPEGAEAFANRLRKRYRHLERWAKRESIACYRVYDADLPEFNLAVDLYEDWVHVQEYAAPSSVDPSVARARFRAAIAVIGEILERPEDRIAVKVRRRQKGRSQYGKLRSFGEQLTVREGGHRFLVNLTDYLDTGLFLDHRPTRALVGEWARGRRFLNLFAYTATATVYAARGGASTTTSVDLSQTYLDWAKQNLELNGIGGRRHELVRADCLSWVEQHREQYGLIFLDPPTFSNSKAMSRSFDVQRDHGWLLQAVLRLLEPGGVLLFSTNRRRFRIDEQAIAGRSVEDLTEATLPVDFQKKPPAHRVFRIQ